MPVSVAYLAVILIWSTTPLGIVWSSESVNPMMAVMLRMLIAALLGWLVIKFSKIELPFDANAMRLYVYSSVGIFGGLAFTYAASPYIASGLISLVFGLAPLISGVLSQKILKSPPLSAIRKLALGIALTGLVIVFSDSLALDSGSIPGLILVLIGMFFFSLSSVLVKSVEITINPIATTVGALLVSLPMFFFAWLFVDGTLPIDQWQARAMWSILYLGLFGSLIGFIAYYYILQKLSPSTVTMVTLITPVIAMTLGALLNNEVITLSLIVGAICITTGLAIFNFGEKLLVRYRAIGDAG